MRHLLMLGFYCKVYRQEPLCRVYVNDVLLDEFNIPHRDQVQHNYDMLDPTNNKKALQHFITNPPFSKYIEFDDAGADALDVVLRIQNDDNNYANGFMSKYTDIVLSQVYLTSKKVLENIDSIVNDYKFNRKNWRKYNANIADFYANSHRQHLFKNFISDTASNFTGIAPKPNEYLGDYRIGCSGDFHLSLVKKLGFWLPSTKYHRGYWRMGKYDHVKYLYDKYKSYEDTRTTDQ